MNFFDDLCTVTEIQAMEQRYHVAVCLVLREIIVFFKHPARSAFNNAVRKEFDICGIKMRARIVLYDIGDLIDLVGMIVLVDWLHVSGGISKILCNIIVLILNYVFSKLFIFNKGVADKPQE